MTADGGCPARAVGLEVREYGDAALLVAVTAGSDEERWAVAQDLGRGLRAADLPGLVDVVASYRDVVVLYDPLVTDAPALSAAVRRLPVRPARPVAGRRFTIPVVYGGEHGPDLDAVAEELAMEASAGVRVHRSADWVVRFRGSPVGAPMMEGPHLPLPVRRLDAPRPRVPVGSVAVSGYQSTIYPAPSPGGWRIIGRTPVRLFRVDHVPPVAHEPGDTFRFRPIPASEWTRCARTLSRSDGRGAGRAG